MAKTLKDLLKSSKVINISGSDCTQISGIQNDSRKINKGNLFIALKGLKVDGHNYIEEAINNGAIAVIGEKDINQINIPKNITYIQVQDSNEALSKIAANFFNNPSQKLIIIGVTGTDGKTTTSHLIYHILSHSGYKVGLISTIAAQIGGEKFDTGFHVTNPEPIALQAFLARMVEKKCEYAVLEVTSHGIDQKRISGISFEETVLTNIAHEHTDYHGSFDKYRDIKLNFVVSGKNIIANKDDSSYSFLERKLNNKKGIISCSKENKADYWAQDMKETKEGLEFTINIENKKKNVNVPVVGRYNISNIIEAIAATNKLGISIENILKALQSFKLPEGRLEKIESKRDFEIIVDFAHTPNALEETFSYLKSKTKGKLIVVFGCAGERDAIKREKMGEISGKLADISVFTAEDPRSESLSDILTLMAKGAYGTGAVEIDSSKRIKLTFKNHYFSLIPERHQAIAFAINCLAKEGDTVVVTGKGHERSMSYDGVEHPWNDREMIENILAGYYDTGVILMAAGAGKRMNSDIPKVLQIIAGRPMISFVIENLRRAKFTNLVAVVGYKKEEVIKEIQGDIKFAIQPSVLGTGDAAQRGLKEISTKIRRVMILNGDDSAFYSPETINAVNFSHDKTHAQITFVSLVADNCEGLGRVIRNPRGELIGIVEDKETTDEQKKITEVNDGLYVFEREWLDNNISKLKKSPKGEYYLVDLIKIALSQGDKVNVFQLPDPVEWLGVNTQEQLKTADAKMRRKLSE